MRPVHGDHIRHQKRGAEKAGVVGRGGHAAGGLDQEHGVCHVVYPDGELLQRSAETGAVQIFDAGGIAHQRYAVAGTPVLGGRGGGGGGTETQGKEKGTSDHGRTPFCRPNVARCGRLSRPGPRSGGRSAGTAASIAAKIGIEHVIAPTTVDLQVALRHALVLEAGTFQHAARRGVFRQAGAFDAAEVERREGVMHDRLQAPRACSPGGRGGRRSSSRRSPPGPGRGGYCPA